MIIRILREKLGIIFSLKKSNKKTGKIPAVSLSKYIKQKIMFSKFFLSQLIQFQKFLLYI
ncbi:MAG: hypothetical protein COZ85_01050 [Candidatus Moranbacteria bacterium CG_4_8_14_3_um_filter_34_16]|nr:MAG: hypothetical protein COT31_00075 [Candidatus Moranbacteria bacterium CG08_land_8_20_14_0_20_34_16]PIW95220.1 MAG: hypothetical protein COZ85_01050 [Candidatus Moranbacteria bacterium CG_4_8_14_3_um_filter_34_16]PJA89373.1 MAG: hypothetical protein CO138_00825 [Candidatus Moranbacteria bacterium CG_4_9_14_3_um_filter_33_15]